MMALKVLIKQAVAIQTSKHSDCPFQCVFFTLTLFAGKHTTDRQTRFQRGFSRNKNRPKIRQSLHSTYI